MKTKGNDIFKLIFVLRERDSTIEGRPEREREKERILSRLCNDSTEPNVA